MNGTKLEILAEAKAEKTLGDHIMNLHMVAGAEGARHHVVRGGRRPPRIMWSPIVFSAFASACIFSFCPFMLFQLLPQPIVLWGKAGHKPHCFISFPVGVFSSF